MNIIYLILVLLVGFLQATFCALEMFLWNTPTGHKIFKLTPEIATGSQVLASNQGLYNLFFTAGLLLSFFLEPQPKIWLQFFCLACVATAGTYGAITVSYRIFFIQALPAILAIGLWFLLPIQQ